MLVKELIEVQVKLTTKAKSLLELNTKDFFIRVGSIRASDTYQSEFIDEVSHILYCMQSIGILELSYTDMTNSGIPHFSSLTDDTSLIIPATREALLRKGVKCSIVDRSITKPSSDVVTGSQMPFDTYVALKYLSKLQSATERGIEFKLTLRDMEKLLKTKKCYYSKVLLELDGDLGLSLDRIDSTKGYIIGNVVACANIVNTIKNELIDTGVNLDALGDKPMKQMLIKFSELIA